MEEQTDEIDVLMSIFPDEFETISSCPHSFKIHLTPNSGSQDNHVAVALVCTFPATYPADVTPQINVEIEKGLGKKHIDELGKLITQCTLDNLGSPSIFAVTEVVKEWLLDNNVAGQDGSMYADMMRKQQQKDVDIKRKADKVANYLAADLENKKGTDNPEEMERIRKRQAGHPVTLESFNSWKEKFDTEMSLLANINMVKIETIADDNRPTGKQLFMQNKVGLELEDELIAEAENESIEDIGNSSSSKADGINEDDDDDDDDDDDSDYEDGDEEDNNDDDDDDYEEES